MRRRPARCPANIDTAPFDGSEPVKRRRRRLRTATHPGPPAPARRLKPTLRGNTEGTPPRATAGTRGYSPSGVSLFLPFSPSAEPARANEPEQARAARDSVEVVHVVINHLRLRAPVPDATVAAARKGMQLVVDAGALAARVAKVDETHLILILEFSTAEDADRIAREVGGPWMRENIRPLLAGDTERSVAEVIASATA